MEIQSPGTRPGNSAQGDQRPRGRKEKAQDFASWVLIGLTIVTVISVVAMYLLPSSGGDQSSPTAGSGTPSGNTVEVELTIDNMAFVPNSVTVESGDRLVVTVHNNATITHDLTLNGSATGMIEPGASVTIDAGEFYQHTQGWCTVSGHRQMGMVFDVYVAGEDPGTGNASGKDNSSSDQPVIKSRHGHGHAAAAATNAAGVRVPTMAERMAARENFHAFDPVLPPVGEGTVHRYTLEAREEVMEVAPGHRQMVWTFNGQRPAPTLRARVGDTIEVTLINKGTMGHSVDFHAGEISPDEPMRTIEPGEQLTYTFAARRAGIWMYHCSTAPMSLHIANGMAGAVVVDPKDADPVDKEYVLVAGEQFLGQEQVGADPDAVASGDFDLLTFNGYANQYDLEPLQVRTGERVRIWVLDVGPDQPVSFHVVGGIFDTVWTEGNYTVRKGLGEGLGAQVLPLQAAQGGFVELTFDEPGTYTFVNHIMTHAERGQHGLIKVS